MPQMNFIKPMTFLSTFEAFCVALNCVMVTLRDEASFHDSGDEAVLDAAQLLSSLLEDSHIEALELTRKLEKRILGMTQDNVHSASELDCLN